MNPNYSFQKEVIAICKKYICTDEVPQIIQELRTALCKRAEVSESYEYGFWDMFEIIVEDMSYVLPVHGGDWKHIIRNASPTKTINFGYKHDKSCDIFGKPLIGMHESYDYWKALLLSFCSFIRLLPKTRFKFD